MQYLRDMWPVCQVKQSSGQDLSDAMSIFFLPWCLILGWFPGGDGIGDEVRLGWRWTNRKLWLRWPDVRWLDSDWAKVRGLQINNSSTSEFQESSMLFRLLLTVRTAAGCGWRPCVSCVKWPNWWKARSHTNDTETFWTEAALLLTNYCGMVMIYACCNHKVYENTDSTRFGGYTSVLFIAYTPVTIF